VADDGEVVGDEQIRETQALLQLSQEIDDLRLDGDI
jgi:hypothetical protein